jgi:hypothetical protein
MFQFGLPDSLKRFAEREFLGERLVWAAQPDIRRAFLLSFLIYLFAIPWTAFSLFWMSVPLGALYEFYSGESIGAPKGAPILMMWVFAIFGTPFLLIGFGMLLAPFYGLWKGRSTLYVLTDKRLATLEGGREVKVVSIEPSQIGSLTRKEKADGRGTLVISHGYERDSDGDRIERKTELGVIDDVRRVEQLVRALRERPA